MKNKLIFLALVFNTIQALPGWHTLFFIPRDDLETHAMNRIRFYESLNIALRKCNFGKIEKILKDQNNHYFTWALGFEWLTMAIKEERINVDQAKCIYMLLRKYHAYIDLNLIWVILYVAIDKQNIELAKLFIDIGFSIDQSIDIWPHFSNDHISLILAAEKGCTKIVQYLISLGVKLDEKGFEGNTALIIAAHNNYALIVYLLLINGADTTIVNNVGFTFFDYIQNKPILIKLYNEINEAKRKIIYNAISKANGFNADMPDVLVDMISDYDC